MSNVVQFPRYVAIEVTSGLVIAAATESADGVRRSRNDVGYRRYFVDVIEADGSRIAMWSGSNRADALHQAKECRRDFGGRVRDLTRVVK